MANFLQKYFPPPPPADGRVNLPSAYRADPPPVYASQRMVKGLPNATVVYGVAASALFVVAIYSLLTGAWFNALLVLFVAACLMGYALYFLRNN